MKIGRVKVLDFDLIATIDGDYIVRLTFGDGASDGQENLKNLTKDETIVWSERIKAGDFKVKLNGTDFEKAVWNELLKIPIGKTVSYSDIARAIGRPKSCRAVGNAVGRNRIAILVPCHRVLRSDGAIGGYYWGAELKKEILKRENIYLGK